MYVCMYVFFLFLFNVSNAMHVEGSGASLTSRYREGATILPLSRISPPKLLYRVTLLYISPKLQENRAY